MAGICVSPYPFSYPIQKVGDSPYSCSYAVNAGIFCQNGNKFKQYAWDDFTVIRCLVDP